MVKEVSWVSMGLESACEVRDGDGGLLVMVDCCCCLAETTELAVRCGAQPHGGGLRLSFD